MTIERIMTRDLGIVSRRNWYMPMHVFGLLQTKTPRVHGKIMSETGNRRGS